jgi:hypothetical protein
MGKVKCSPTTPPNSPANTNTITTSKPTPVSEDFENLYRIGNNKQIIQNFSKFPPRALSVRFTYNSFDEFLQKKGYLIREKSNVLAIEKKNENELKNRKGKTFCNFKRKMKNRKQERYNKKQVENLITKRK